MLGEALPGSAAFVSENIDAVIRLRGAAGVASIAGLLWSASKMSSAVSQAKTSLRCVRSMSMNRELCIQRARNEESCDWLDICGTSKV